MFKKTTPLLPLLLIPLLLTACNGSEELPTPPESTPTEAVISETSPEETTTGETTASETTAERSEPIHISFDIDPAIAADEELLQAVYASNFWRGFFTGSSDVIGPEEERFTISDSNGNVLYWRINRLPNVPDEYAAAVGFENDGKMPFNSVEEIKSAVLDSYTEQWYNSEVAGRFAMSYSENGGWLLPAYIDYRGGVMVSTLDGIGSYSPTGLILISKDDATAVIAEEYGEDVPGGPYTIELTFVREGGKWKLNEIA